MNLHEVLHAGSPDLCITALSITGAMLLGLGLGYLIHVQKKTFVLISAGTAICGGSAIAAVGPIPEANEEEDGRVAWNGFYSEFPWRCFYFR